MQKGWRFVGFCQEGFDFLLPLFQANHLRIDLVGRASLEDQIEEGIQLALDLLYLGLRRSDVGAAFHAEAINLLCEDLAEPGEQRRVDKSGTQGVQDTGLQLIAPDVDAIVASALVPCRGAAEQRRRDRRIPSAAAGAFGETGKEILRAPATVDRRHIGVPVLISRDPVSGLACLHFLPELVIQDAQLRHVLVHPFLFRIRPRLPLARIGVLHEALAVPDDLADVHFVVEDAVPALRVAVDCAEAPIPTGGGRDALLVEREGDRLGRLARGIVTENTANDLGLRFIDRSASPDRFAIRVEFLDNIIAVCVSATGLAGFDATALTPPCLVGQILEEERVHRALETYMQMRDFALGEGEDFHVRIGHALEQAGDVLLVSREAVHRLGKNEIEAAARRIRDQRLYARPQERGAGDGMIGIFLDDDPALFLGMETAHAKLIGDGCIALIVGGIAGVDGDFQCASPKAIRSRVSPAS